MLLIKQKNQENGRGPERQDVWKTIDADVGLEEVQVKREERGVQKEGGGRRREEGRRKRGTCKIGTKMNWVSNHLRFSRTELKQTNNPVLRHRTI